MARPVPRPKVLLGPAVFGALIAIEVIEYVIGTRITPGALPLLIILAVPGAGVIVWFFMHLPQLWGEEED